MQQGPYFYNSAKSDFIRDLTSPLKGFGINHFAFIRMFDKQSFRLADQPNWLRTYFENEFYNDTNLYQEVINDLELGEEKFKFLTNQPEGPHQNLLMENNLWHFLLHFKRSKNFVDFWCFSSDPSNSEILNDYIGNLDKYKNIANQLVSKIVLEMEEDHTPQKFITTDLSLPKLKNKYAYKHLNCGQIINTELTEKQNQCLFFVMRGFSNKRIASELNISPRTVESYITQLNLKFDVTCKSELAYRLNIEARSGPRKMDHGDRIKGLVKSR